MNWMRCVTSGRPMRLLLALLLTPVGAWGTGLLIILPYAFIQKAAGGRWSGVRLELINVLFAVLHLSVVLIFAFVPLILTALMAHLMLATLRLGWGAIYALAGTLVGMALVWTIMVIRSPGLDSALWGWTEFLVLGAVPGLGGGLTFWAVLRPDRAVAASGQGAPGHTGM